MADYFTISADCIYEEKIKRSRFIAHLHAATAMEEVKAFISRISSEHDKANHNCWAYILGDQGQTEHASDQGEPPGTAGKPMLNVLRRHNLTNVVVVVTRYFGGTKLGVPGLIEAYTHIVEQAVLQAEMKPLVHTVQYQVKTDYQQHDFIRHRIMELGAQEMNAEFTESVLLAFSVQDEMCSFLDDFLDEMKVTRKIDHWSKTKDHTK